jgi:hypothetical protein
MSLPPSPLEIENALTHVKAADPDSCATFLGLAERLSG